jgi:TRAP-type C4-dicarboxylate transport system permease small subunit
MINKIYQLLLKTETGILVALLISMMVMAVVQIILRNVFSSGISWADAFVRISVLWLAFVGAMVASRSGRHIIIDVFLKTLNEKTQHIVQRITDVFTAVVCFVITFYSFKFVKFEYGDAGLAFSNIPNWLCEAIIPFAFLIIGLRYFFSAIYKRHLA